MTEDTKPATPWYRLATTIFMMLAVVAGAILRWHEIDTSLWLDEALTYEGASRSIWFALAHRAYPLYYVLANLALRFEDSETALRFPSFVAGLLTIPAVYALGMRVGGRGVGVVSALLLTFNVYHIRYSQEARFYALVMLGSVLMTWFLYRALTRDKMRYWVAFTVAAFFSLVSQLSVLPFFAALLASAGCWMVASVFSQEKRIPWRDLSILGLVAVCSVSGLCAGMATRGSTGIALLGLEQDESVPEDEGDPAMPAFRLTIPQYAEYLLDFTPLKPERARWALAVLACAGLGALWARNRCLATIFTSQFLLAPLPYLVLDSSHWFASRYFCSLTPLYLVLIATGIVACAALPGHVVRRLSATGKRAKPEIGHRSGKPALSVSRWGTVFIAVAIAALIPLHAAAISRYFERRPATNWKGLAEYMAQRIQPKDTIVLLPPAEGGAPKPIGVFLVPLHYYLARSLPTYFPENHYAVAGTLRYTGATTIEELNHAIAERPGNGIWFVMRNERSLPNGFARTIRKSSDSDREHFGRIILRHRPPRLEPDAGRGDSAPTSPLE